MAILNLIHLLKKSILTENARATKKLGEFLAKEILQTKLKKGAFCLALNGQLGGGKTTFLQGFAKGLGIKEKILSPTFVLLKRFKIPNSRSQKFKIFYHLDCYRIKKPKEILGLGFEKIVSNSQNLIAIEWAERIKKILPKNTITIEFNFINENTRQIKIKN